MSQVRKEPRRRTPISAVFVRVAVSNYVTFPSLRNWSDLTFVLFRNNFSFSAKMTCSPFCPWYCWQQLETKTDGEILLSTLFLFLSMWIVAKRNHKLECKTLEAAWNSTCFWKCVFKQMSERDSIIDMNSFIVHVNNALNWKHLHALNPTLRKLWISCCYKNETLL